MGCGGSKAGVALDSSVEKVIEMLSNRPVNEYFT